MFSAPPAHSDPFLERETELAAIERAVDDVVRGAGRVIAVEAPAGIGKTALLEAGADLAARAGLLVLRARGAELEQDFGFGIPNQLFGRTVRARPELLRGRAALAAAAIGVQPSSIDSGEALYAALQGLYWLTVDLAEETPVALVVDDVHWADPASARFLAHLAHRIDGVRVLLMTARRPTSRRGNPVHDLSGTELLELRPLSEEGTATLVRSLAPDTAQERAQTCYRATGGNALYVHAVVRAWADDGEAKIASADWSPATITRRVDLQLQRLSSPARNLAGAMSILGPQEPLRHAAAICDLDDAAAAQAVDELVDGDILAAGDAPGFSHPIVRAAVRDHLGPGERERLHRGAARLLAQDGSPAPRIAVHLLHCDPGDDDWTVSVLRAAAREALSQGTPETAARYLRRALAETPAAGELVGLLVDLAQAEAATFDREAAAVRLREAYEAAANRDERLLIASHLAVLLGHSAGSPDGIELLARTRQEFLDEPRIALRIDARMANIGRGDRLGRRLSLPGAAARLRDAAAPGESDPEVLSAAAAELTMTAEPAARAAELAGMALARPDATAGPEVALTQLVAVRVLIVAEHFELAEQALGAALEASRRTGSILGTVFNLVFLTELLVRRGELLDAEAKADSAYSIAAEHGWPAGTPWLVASMVEVLVERGHFDQAEQLLGRADLLTPARGLSSAYTSNLLLATRGRLRIAQGNPASALEDLRECGRREQEWGESNPALVRWRSLAAEALAELGEGAEARTLALEDVRLARRYGAPRALGIALRACARVTDGPDGDALAEEACDTLATSAARLEYAHALSDLSDRHLACARVDQARPLLETALELADRCAATALEARVRAQLRATGARPRRAQRSGPRSLTPSQRQIATLAASGCPNREIAEALFITQRTVEFHLSRVYRKLGITSRRELEAAMAAQPR